MDEDEPRLNFIKILIDGKVIPPQNLRAPLLKYTLHYSIFQPRESKYSCFAFLYFGKKRIIFAKQIPKPIKKTGSGKASKIKEQKEKIQ